jgi:hypothetical protein
MFGSTVLEVAIGLSFVYVLLSLVCSAITEFVSRLLALRASTLEQSINRLLTAEDREKLYDHPIIKGLGSKPHLLRRIVDRLRRQSHEGRPAYIPSRLFARALLDIVVHGERGSATWPANGAGLLKALENEKVRGDTRRAIRAVVQASGAEAELEAAVEGIEDWFDDAMDRASGWYTRQARAILFVTALIISTAYNADTLTLANELAVDSTLRQVVVEGAAGFVGEDAADRGGAEEAAGTDDAALAGAKEEEEAAAESDAGTANEPTIPELNTQLGALGLPLGWCAVKGDGGGADGGAESDDRTPAVGTRNSSASTGVALGSTPDQPPFFGLVPWCEDPDAPNAVPADPAGWLIKLEGLLLTSLALTLGATFWFDVLKGLVSLRDHGKVPPRASEEEE